MCQSPLLYVFFPQVGNGWGQPFQVGPFCPEQATAALQVAMQLATAIPTPVAAVTYAASAALGQWVPLANFILPKLPGVALEQLAGEGVKGRTMPAQEAASKAAAFKAQDASISSPWRYFNFAFGAQCVTGGSVPQKLYPVSVLSFASSEQATAAARELAAQMGRILPQHVFEVFTYATNGKEWRYVSFAEFWGNPTLCEDGRPWRPLPSSSRARERCAIWWWWRTEAPRRRCSSRCLQRASSRCSIRRSRAIIASPAPAA